VPLFGYANAAGSTLRLNEDQRVGVVPIHPAQRGSRSAFAFLVFGDSLSPRLNHGETGYAVRNKTPVKGQPVLIEMVSGEVLVKIFERVDEHTVFLRPAHAEEGPDLQAAGRPGDARRGGRYLPLAKPLGARLQPGQLALRSLSASRRRP
jgi:hypothetical protein